MLQAGHPDDHVLDLYCMNKLEGEQLDAFEDHLLVCGNCQDRVTQTDSFVRGMKSALTAPEPEPKKLWLNVGRFFQAPGPLWATGAFAAACVAGMIGIYHSVPERPPLAIALSATRGGLIPAARSGNALDLDLDVRDLSLSSDSPVQIVNGSGKEVWSGHAYSLNDSRLHVLVKRINAGQYYVRITDSGGTHREFALAVEQ